MIERKYTHKIRVCMLYEYKQCANPSIATKNIKQVFGDHSLDTRTCRRWFKKFTTGDFCLADDQRTGRPIQFDRYALLALVKTEPHLSTRQMATKLNTSQSSVQHHLLALGIKSKRTK